MRGFLKHLFDNTAIGHSLLSLVKKLYDIYIFRVLPEKIFIQRTFKILLGYNLNLENPKTLNEKVQWLQLNDRTPLHTLCTDKYAVREYVKEKIGEQYLIPLVYHTNNPADIIPENLPDFPCIIKTNHGCGGHVIVKNKSKIDWKSVQKNLAKSLKSNYYYILREWQYKNIEPCIVVEKLLLDKNFNIPYDYKFHCCNGRVVCISADMDRDIDYKRNLYDTDWNFIDCRMRLDNGDVVERPEKLNKMMSFAEILAKDFRYVRVDLYNVGSEVYIGELTFSPAAGFQIFIPLEWDRIFGDELML